MPRVALVTDRLRSQLFHDDRWLLRPFGLKGVGVAAAVWDDATVDWSDFDAIILRSPWDYTTKPDAFLRWVDHVGARLWNPPEIVRWNLNKSYLADLAARGVTVADTTRMVRETVALEPLVARFGDLVVKPEVSSTGKDTWRVNAGTMAAVADKMRTRGGAWLVQPFVAEVATEGELSFVFLDGQYSHAVRKRPAVGKFLVHEEHGGTIQSTDPTKAQIAWAQRACEALPARDLLYARVDAIPARSGLVLVELELVEPELFFRYEPSAPEAMVAGVLRRLG
jgi:glutathione synthase/RimK-type ligase-like ATP-grasp enzyme